MKTALLLLLAVLAIIFGPFISIWSLNTLFPALEIVYTFETWLAMMIIHATFLVKKEK